MTIDTMSSTSRFLCIVCGATRTSRYRQWRANLTCSRCGRPQRHEKIPDRVRPDDYRELNNQDRMAEAGRLLAEADYLRDITDRLGVEVSGYWDERYAKYLYFVVCVDWAGRRRWRARINPDATLKGQLFALEGIIETVVRPKKWLGDGNEDVRAGRSSWCREPRQGDLLP